MNSELPESLEMLQLVLNNLLMSILGNANLALNKLSALSPAREHLLDVERAAQRAAEICRQMPACSDKRQFISKESRGEGMVLLVDDEDGVRMVGKRMLETLGFQALVAGNGREALDLFRRREAEIECVLLDLTMPDMDGEQTFRELRRLQPDVRIIMSSGYNAQEVTERFAGKRPAGFIQKPYQIQDLERTLRETLAKPSSAADI